MKKILLKITENPRLFFNLGLSFFIGLTLKICFMPSPYPNVIFIGTTIVVLTILTLKDLRKT